MQFILDVAHMTRVAIPTRSDTNRAMQLQKMASDLKFLIKVVDGLYYRCSETIGADQLRSDLRLCFRICKNQVFSRLCCGFVFIHVRV